MPEAVEPTPPPERTLSEQQRARIHAELAAAAQPHGGWHHERWLMPGLTAAAVAAIVGVGAYASNLGSDADGPQTPAPLGPAASSTGPTATSPPTSESPTAASTSPPAPVVHPSDTTAQIFPTGPFPDVSCDDEVVNVDEPRLQGATVTAQRDYGPATTYLYETKTAWVVCDDLTTDDGGVPTLLSLHDKSKPYNADASTLAVSENIIVGPDGSWTDQFVAGGRDFDGVQAISYSFPDGHTEHAVVGENGLWSMVYLATDGVFVDPKTNETRLDPIKVSVEYSYDNYSSLSLEWGLDTCAQLNHGC